MRGGRKAVELTAATKANKIRRLKKHFNRRNGHGTKARLNDDQAYESLKSLGGVL